MKAEWKNIADKLPRSPGGDLRQDLLESIYGEGESLGEFLILVSRESVEVIEEPTIPQSRRSRDSSLCTREPIKRIMTAEEFERMERSRRWRWGARCTCSNCGEDFTAGYLPGKDTPGIVLYEGEDGVTYDGWAEEGAEGTVSCRVGETTLCPKCWTVGKLVKRTALRNGRTHQVLQAETVNVDSFTAVVYWMVSRWQDDGGSDTVSFSAHEALVIDGGGKLRRFRAVRHGGEETDFTWTPCSKSRDPMQKTYYSYDAVNGRKVGGWVCAYGPELGGSTGEKTALDEYVGSGGTWPGAYLHVWQKYPQVENLMRQGFALAVQTGIDDYLDRCCRYADLRDAPPIKWANWREKKPHRMLGMSKEAFRVIRKERWTAADAEGWSRWRAVLGGEDARCYEECRRKIGVREIEKLLQMIQAGWGSFEPQRVVRYLEKQGLLHGGVQTLIDHRKMLRDEGIAETEETLWPRDLNGAHDRLAQSVVARRGLEYARGFAERYIELEGLAWTDGELCIVIPKSEQELIDEGNVLRHCVGTYGRTHCGGKPVFFVRRYRRPERSYYTLNIDMTGNCPREIQLHGYGNERHGEHKEHKHTIPKKVRAFCDRWEREVLTPWWRERCRAKENGNKKKNGRKSA